MSDKKNSSEISTAELKSNENFNKILSAISDLREDFTQRFDSIEKRLDGVEKRLDGVEKRLDGVEKRLDGVEKRLDGVEKRLDGLEVRVGRIENEQSEMRQFLDVQFEAIRIGIVKNYNQFDRIEAQISENRAVIYNTKAMVGELTEKMFLLTRDNKQRI